MTTTSARLRDALQRFAFGELFTQELGWNRGHGKAMVDVRGSVYELAIVAEKCGVQVFVCPPEESGRIPPADVRAAIDREVTKHAYEHLIIFEDAAHSEQIWLYPKREAGRPVRLIAYRFDLETTNELLLQKLSAISFSLGEEETLTLFEVTSRLRETLDRDKLTKTFYQAFSAEREAFQKMLRGIPDEELERWYVAVLMNRLMFIYFVQEKGFLDGDQHYLQTRLKDCRGNYYRDVLCPLFFEGFATPEAERSAAVRKALGRIPYLNGGIFQKHQIEELHGKTIDIPNSAFEKLFAFFDRWRWHLDERPLAAGNEINPDVLGYIFEKYVNQKQMGAYYTKEDITEYISKNTVLPFLLDAAKAKCRVAFENPGGPTVWDLLRDDPDRYIYAAIRHGVHEPLPDEIAEGLNPPTLHDPVGEGTVATLELRKPWNKPAPSTHALPTETWREHIARRQRYEEVGARLAAGDVRDVNDLITLNLDIRQFVQDVIENCDGPDLLRAIWHAIENVTVLDPTCGSGAFLFAALNILEPLYEACLARMEAFLDDLERSGEKHRPEKLSDFRRVLDRVAAHPNRRYFIFKSIILNNLYGVDIMEEAVEICKLRLFLKLAAQVEPDAAKPNLGIEPLPDIDFNIKAGNTLVGYTTLAGIEKATGARLDFAGAAGEVALRASDLQQAFDVFRRRQTESADAAPPADKQELQSRLAELGNELDGYLAGEYEVETADRATYARWSACHRPFHWFVEFHGIISRGGFDVVIGNPPWKEYSAVKKDYTVRDYSVLDSGNLYALCTERALLLMKPGGWLSYIVQLPLVSSARMAPLRNFLVAECGQLFLVPCDDRPGKLFDGLQNCRSCIYVAQKRLGERNAVVLTTRYNRWPTEARAYLFDNLSFEPLSDQNLLRGQFPKLALETASAFTKLFRYAASSVATALEPRPTSRFVFYVEATRYWVKAVVGVPYYEKNGVACAPPHGRYLYFRSVEHAEAVCAVLNSSFFYTYFVAYGDCFHLSAALASSFPIANGLLEDRALRRLHTRLVARLAATAVRKTIDTKDGARITYDEFEASQAKPVVDDMDAVLGRLYRLTEAELDAVANYDMKYRVSSDTEDEGDDE